MFPEFRDLISRLKVEDSHFARLFHHHNELDQQIRNIEAGAAASDGTTIQSLKKEKLQLKDALYEILKKAAQA